MIIVHAADLHLDSPLCGLERYDGAPVATIRSASRRALTALVDLCLAEPADLLLIAGDVYDGNWRDYSTGLFFAAEMSRLREAEIPVVLVRGNHDAASVITRNLRLPDNVRELSTRAPESIELDSLGVVVHGQSYPRRAVGDDLAATYPAAVAGALNIGLLHTALTGREGHSSYAPCRLETLLGKGYDYWALGHVHRREVVAEDPWVVFPGNLQGRHMRETGAKGATVVVAVDGRIARLEHRPLDVVRFGRRTIDATGASDPDDVIERVRAALEQEIEDAEGRVLAARVSVTGRTPAHRSLQDDPERWLSEARAAATDLGGDGVWLERLVLRTGDELDREALAERDDPVGQLVRALAALADDEAALRALGSELHELARRLPHELRDGPDGVRLDDPAALRAALADVEQILLPRLLAAGREP